MDIWLNTFPISTIEIEISNGCNWLNIALRSHNLTWFGCLRHSSAMWWRQPSDRDDPQVHSCTLPCCKRILERYVLSTENWRFEIALFLSLQWELKFLNCYNWLNIPLGSLNWLKIWMFYTLPTNSVETISRYILVLYLLQRNLGEICVLHWVVNIWNCTFLISTMGIEIFIWLQLV